MTGTTCITQKPVVAFLGPPSSFTHQVSPIFPTQGPAKYCQELAS